MARPIIKTPSAVLRQESYPKTASVDGSQGDWVTFASGYLARATSSSTFLLGLLNADWTNDSNHTNVNVDVDEHAIYEMDVTNGPLVQATHVGNKYDLSDQATLDLNATTNKNLRVVGITATGRALCKLATPA